MKLENPLTLELRPKEVIAALAAATIIVSILIRNTTKK